jgi:hypothetical protein
MITKGAAFDLEACGDNRATGFAHELVKCKPLVNRQPVKNSAVARWSVRYPK